MTHDVTNQPPPLTGGNAWRGDPLLVQIAEGFSEPVRKDLDGLGRSDDSSPTPTSLT